MLLISCPFCGPRAEVEFRCGGELNAIAVPETTTDVAWAEHLFFHRNPKGITRERWVHAAGCRQWFGVARDTATHEIHAVWRLDEEAPEFGL